MLTPPRLRARGVRAGAWNVRGLVLAPMDHLPAPQPQRGPGVVAHGTSLRQPAPVPPGAEFRRAVREAARVARAGAALFVFTFSRHTLPADALPVTGETFVFTQFSGQPQVFLTESQLLAEMRDAGFERDVDLALTE